MVEVPPEVMQAARRKQTAALDDRHPVAEVLGLDQVVGRQDHGPALLAAERGDQVPHAARGEGIEVRGGLVEEQQLGVVDEGSGQSESLLEAGGEAASGQVRMLGQSKLVDERPDAVDGATPWSTP